MRRLKEKTIKVLLFITALVAVVGVILITIFVFGKGWPFWEKYGLFKSLMGRVWLPNLDGESIFGLVPLIVGSFCVTAIASLLAVPLGVGCAIYLAEIASDLWSRMFRPAVSLLAAIPSVVYGFFGLIVLVPVIRDFFGGLGFSLLAGGIILAIMILPTIIAVSEDAIRAVPKSYKEASLALGASRWQTIYRTIVPAARSGIIAAVILGIGRALGETMAVIMVTGNRPLIPKSILDPGVTLTGTIGTEWAYASGEHTTALFAVGSVLFVLIMLINSIAIVIKNKGELK
ncbi:MAG TPA: phosphate ABC transporter permease subunit PstC [Firmicutes bacterium]|nr:phosphate ABC transporter permease subunit PstC [Bacillota bacterium]